MVTIKTISGNHILIKNPKTSAKKNLNSLMIKINIELEMTVITKINTEMLLIAYVII